MKKTIIAGRVYDVKELVSKEGKAYVEVKIVESNKIFGVNGSGNWTEGFTNQWTTFVMSPTCEAYVKLKKQLDEGAIATVNNVGMANATKCWIYTNAYISKDYKTGEPIIAYSYDKIVPGHTTCAGKPHYPELMDEYKLNIYRIGRETIKADEAEKEKNYDN